MVKTDPKITSRKAVLDSDDELKNSDVKPTTTPDLKSPPLAVPASTIVTLPNSQYSSPATHDVSASAPAWVPTSKALGDFLELFEAKEQLYGNKATSTPKNVLLQFLSLQVLQLKQHHLYPELKR